MVPSPCRKPNKLFGMRLFFSKNQSRRNLIMYSTILHYAEDKVIGRNAVGEVLGLGMGMIWYCFQEGGIRPEIQMSLRIRN